MVYLRPQTARKSSSSQNLLIKTNKGSYMNDHELQAKALIYQLV